MAHWLMKTEPDVLSYDDIAKKKQEEWHGVRNYAARNNMKAMKLGEEVFIYHSVQGKEIVGIAKVIALAHPDSTAEPNENGKVVWECVDVVAVKKLPKPVTLETIKATRTTTREIINHALSLLTFIGAMAEFLVVKGFGTSTFFFISAMCLFDVVAGYSISIVAAKRDVHVMAPERVGGDDY